MEPLKEHNIPRPPGILSAIKSGFNAVSTHIYILVLPVAIDFFLWLGPRAKATTLLNGLLDELMVTAQQTQMPESMVSQSISIWKEIIPRINFFTAIRTFPVGVPGLMWARLPEKTPLPSLSIWELTSWNQIIWLVTGVMVTGWVAGSLFLYIASRITAEDAPAVTPRQFFFMLANSLFLMLLWNGILMFIGGSLMMASAFLFMLNPALGETAMVLALLAATWFIVPYYFSPYGIFNNGENAIESLLSAFRFSRQGLFLPSFFVFTVFVSAYLSGLIWNTPPDTSWLLGIGIVGHAIVSATLISASFIYYRALLHWQKLLATILPRS